MELMEFEEYEILHKGIYELSATLNGLVSLVKNHKALNDDIESEIVSITSHSRFLNHKIAVVLFDSLESKLEEE